MTARPWICPHCDRAFPVDSLCTEHQPTCPLRPRDAP
jgi:hypothetical protein